MSNDNEHLSPMYMDRYCERLSDDIGKYWRVGKHPCLLIREEYDGKRMFWQLRCGHQVIGPISTVAEFNTILKIAGYGDTLRLAQSVNTPLQPEFFVAIGSGEPTQRYPTKNIAELEAQRLAEENKGQEFIVMKPVSSVIAKSTQWKFWEEPEAPF